jgi:hypothetical protein
MIFGVAVGSLWLAGARRAPGRTVRNSGFRRGMATGSLLVLIPGVPLLLTFPLTEDRNFLTIVDLSAYAAALIALAVTSGVAVGLHELLVERSGQIGRAGPNGCCGTTDDPHYLRR